MKIFNRSKTAPVLTSVLLAFATASTPGFAMMVSDLSDGDSADIDLQSVFIGDLPPEMMVEILDELDVRALLKFGLINKSVRLLINSTPKLRRKIMAAKIQQFLKSNKPNDKDYHVEPELPSGTLFD
jgi:hypothetical protein